MVLCPQALSLEGCVKVSDKGVKALLHGPASGNTLRTLNVSGCPRLTAAALQLHNQARTLSILKFRSDRKTFKNSAMNTGTEGVPSVLCARHLRFPTESFAALFNRPGARRCRCSCSSP